MNAHDKPRYDELLGTLWPSVEAVVQAVAGKDMLCTQALILEKDFWVAAPENANVKLFAALAKVILETVPADRSRDEFRQGNTMGAEFRHWRRAKFGRQFRLFFRYDSASKVIKRPAPRIIFVGQDILWART